MVGVTGADIEGQTEFLYSLMTGRTREILRGDDVYGRACAANGESGYGPADGDVLFAFIAGKKPAKIIQIGCGVSTSIILDAARHADYSPGITCIDPYPTEMLRDLGSAGRVTLIARKAQDLNVAELVALGADDLLFVDSSHTTCPNSDVNRIILDALPRLPAGVFVHFHDIAFPYDFGPNILGPNDLFFGAESLLLHAYLIHNSRCRIALSMSMLHHSVRGALKDLLVTIRRSPPRTA
jgi:predicted O-methyltransferase YrrM